MGLQGEGENKHDENYTEQSSVFVETAYTAEQIERCIEREVQGGTRHDLCIFTDVIGD